LITVDPVYPVPPDTTFTNSMAPFFTEALAATSMFKGFGTSEVVKDAVATAPEPLPPENVTSAYEYPSPPFVMVMEFTPPAAIVAVAVAPTPSPSIVTVGAERYPEPAEVMVADITVPLWSNADDVEVKRTGT